MPVDIKLARAKIVSLLKAYTGKSFNRLDSPLLADSCRVYKMCVKLSSHNEFLCKKQQHKTDIWQYKSHSINMEVKYKASKKANHLY